MGAIRSESYRHAAETRGRIAEMMTPEGKVKAEIKAKLTELGAYFFMPVQTGYGARTVDILACIDGRFVAIEVKKPGVHKGTALQEDVLKEVRDAGGVAFVAQSWDDVAAVIVED
jgi:hypothetical protein